MREGKGEGRGKGGEDGRGRGKGDNDCVSQVSWQEEGNDNADEVTKMSPVDRT